LSVTQFLESTETGAMFGKCGIALVILFTLIQIAPIQINPWSWIGRSISRFFKMLGRKIGKELNGEVVSKLGEINTRLDDMDARFETVESRLGDLEEYNRTQDKNNAEEKALDARRRILRFADEIRSGDRHSKEHFDNVFDDIKFYKNYCDTNKDFKNDRAQISIKIIEETYEKCVRENDFL
jgi:hypothetical protein